MSDDEERRPAEQGRRFPFLKRGTGSQKYNKIHYITCKSSSGSQFRPSTTSISSGYPSTSAYVDVEIPRKREIPPLQMSPPVAGSGPDSGRGSAAPQEQIYMIPSNRSVESGYGGFNRSFITTPDRTDQEVEPDELVNDYPSSVHDPNVHQESSTDNDEVFLPNDHQAISPALSSFVRHENEIAQELAGESEMSTPTRELRQAIEIRRPINVNRSQSSLATNPANRTDQESLHSDDGPLSSTPINFGQEPSPAQIEVQAEVPKRIYHVKEHKETPILGETTDSENGSSVGSTATSVPQSYQIESISNTSLSSVRRLIAANDRPIREAFPEIRHTTEAQTPPIRPSESTQYDGRPFIMQEKTQQEDNLRRAAIRNQTRARREQITPALTSSSDDWQPTPLRKLIPKTTDPVVKEYRRQLRDSVAHMDLGHANLHDAFKKIKFLKKTLDDKIAHIDEQHAKFEQDREEWELEKRKMQECFKKERLNLDRREREFQQLQTEKDKENRDMHVTNKSSLAGMRIQLSNKDKEIKQLKTELEAKEQSRARLERLMEQQNNNNKREQKKLRDENADLQKRLALAEADSTKRRNGLQPRAFSRASTVQTTASQTGNHSLPLLEPDEVPDYYDSHSRSHSFNAFHEIPIQEPSRKQVQFNLGRNVVYNDSYVNMSDYHKFIPAGTSEHPMGLCRHFWNEDTNEMTYMYELRHSNGEQCKAKIFKYPTNDSKWIFGPLEVNLYHKYPLIVKIRGIDVEIKVFEETTEIHREYMEISCLNRETATITELRRRKDLSGYYAINLSTKTEKIESIYGVSDRSLEEDSIALRRGTLQDRREYVDIKSGKQGYEVHWISEKIPTREVKSYKVISVGIGGSKIQVELHDEIIDITAWPERDYIIIRHRRGAIIPCCDLGKPSRDRERAGIFEPIGKLESL